MKCPRCTESVLEEREHEGVTVDACRSCYGIWLDRGEIERLIARARDDFEEMERREYRAARPEPHYDDRPRRFDDDDHHRYRYAGHDGRYGKRRKRWFETLGDIFD